MTTSDTPLKSTTATTKQPLRLERIVASGKPVRWVDGAKVDIEPKGRLGTDLSQLISNIEQGKELGAANYRSGPDNDRLLETHGILHLHIGSSKSKELLYVVQFDDEVVILALSDHRYINERPVTDNSLQSFMKEALTPLAASTKPPKVQGVEVTRVRRRVISKDH